MDYLLSGFGRVPNRVELGHATDPSSCYQIPTSKSGGYQIPNPTGDFDDEATPFNQTRLSGSGLIRDEVESPVFILDLMSVPLSDAYEILRDVFVSDNVLKLGFRFKQDLVYLNSTFESLGGFDRVIHIS